MLLLIYRELENILLTCITFLPNVKDGEPALLLWSAPGLSRALRGIFRLLRIGSLEASLWRDHAILSIV